MGGADLNFLRTFRVLRPLRTLSKFPRMRRLVQTILGSIPKLGDVAAMALFVAVWASIIGVTFWAGSTHRRCRLTSEPLHFVQNAAECELSQGWCFDSVSTSVWVHRGIDFPSTCPSSDSQGSRPCGIEGNNDWVEVDGAALYKAFCEDVTETYQLRGKCVEAVATDPNGYWHWPVDYAGSYLCGGSAECGTAPELSVQTVSNFNDTAFLEHVYDQLKILQGIGKKECLDASGNVCDADLALTCGNNFIEDPEQYGADNTMNRTAPVDFPAQLDATFRYDIRTKDYDLDWANFNYGVINFDNCFYGLLSIFQCITLEGWAHVMYMMQDSHAEWFSTLFFVVLILFGHFFLLNVTLAIVADAFAENTSKELEDADVEQEEEAEHDEFVATHHNPFLSLTESTAFNAIITATIVMSTITLCLDGYPEESRTMFDFQIYSNYVFLAIFTVEMVLMILAWGPVHYVTNFFTIFDGFIVVSSMLETLVFKGDIATAFRAFRFFRIIKLFKRFETFHHLMVAVLNTLVEVSFFVLLLLVIMLVFALFGTMNYAGTMMFDDYDKPIAYDQASCVSRESFCGEDKGCFLRPNYDDFWNAMLAVWVIISGENWNSMMYATYRTVGWPSAVYYAVCIVVGSFILLNLFLAILMSNFQRHSEAAPKPSKSMSRQSRSGFSESMSRVSTVLETKKSSSLSVFKKMSSSIYDMGARLGGFNRWSDSSSANEDDGDDSDNELATPTNLESASQDASAESSPRSTPTGKKKKRKLKSGVSFSESPERGSSSSSPRSSSRQRRESRIIQVGGIEISELDLELDGEPEATVQMKRPKSLSRLFGGDHDEFQLNNVRRCAMKQPEFTLKL